ncbi:uroporphyrinogen decarboxylase family protein [Caldicellulosiruptoraceae bacterium PP1]
MIERNEMVMNSKERVNRTLNFEEVDKIPRQLWFLPGVAMFRSKELNSIIEKYPNDIIGSVGIYRQGDKAKGELCKKGYYVDSWGSVFYVAEDGVIGEVKEPAIQDWEKLDSYQPPLEILDENLVGEVNKYCEQNKDKFIVGGTDIRPFERMQFLRGTENLFIDIALDEEKLYKLRDMLHEFYIKELSIWMKTDVDAISFMDDWGSQTALLISPESWRELFKPLYKEYCDIIHSHGKYVFFHSDGFIEDIYPDLIEIGINAVNSQLFCMDIEKLGQKYAGKIVFWGEVDRQYLLPFGKQEEVRKGVRRVAKALMPNGIKTGVIAQCEWGINDPIENIQAVFDEWENV